MSRDNRLVEVMAVSGPSLPGTGKGIVREAGGNPESVFRRCKTAHWCPLKRPARRRQRRWVRAGKVLRRHRRGIEEFLEPADDPVRQRSPGRLTRRQRHGVSVGSGMQNTLATVAARPSAAVLCEPGLPATSHVSRAWGLVWNLPESSRVSASVAVTTWPRRRAMRAGGRIATTTWGGCYRFESYDPDTGGLVSRKSAQLGHSQELMGFGFLNELAGDVAPGATISPIPSCGGLAGQFLQGQMIWEIPVQKGPIPQAVSDAATHPGIILRDVNRKSWLLCWGGGSKSNLTDKIGPTKQLLEKLHKPGFEVRINHP